MICIMRLFEEDGFVFIKALLKEKPIRLGPFKTQTLALERYGALVKEKAPPKSATKEKKGKE